MTDTVQPHLAQDHLEPAPPHDREIVAAQIGRDPRAMAGVAVRCVHGFPAVTRQSPTDDRGRPFPTAYYVTCPHLVRQIDRVESGGGVRRFEEHTASDEVLAASLAAAQARHRAIDDRGSNIAGCTDPTRVKCLHAHAAMALANPPHELGLSVLREAAPRWCDDARCAALTAPSIDAP